MIKLNYKKTILDNGLRVITVPMKNTSTVTSVIFVKTGSRYENKEENGISHLLEHMFFQGTKKRPDKMSVKRELDRIGARSNASTGHDKTAYYIKTDSKHLDLSLDILSDMYLNSLFKSDSIEKEKKVVIEEMNMYKDNPQREIWDNFYNLLYSGNSLGWPIIGTTDIVSSIKRSNFFDYTKKYYFAANTVVVVAGNINEKKVIEKVKNYFKKIKNGPISKIKPFLDDQKMPRINLEYKKIDQAHIVLGVKTCSIFDQKRYIFDLLSDILGGYFSSRLIMSVRDNLGLSYYVGSDTGYHEDTGYFSAYAGINLEKINIGINAILKEFKNVKSKLITKKEIEDAKSHLEGSLGLYTELSDNIAMRVGTLELFHNKIETPEEYLKKIKAITASDIKKAANEIFKTAKLNLAIIGPFKDKNKFAKILKL